MRRSCRHCWAQIRPPTPPDFREIEGVDSELVIDSLLSDPTLTQLILRRNHDGVENISGHFRVAVLPDQQRVSWHFPITPALSVEPVVDAEAVDRSDIRISYDRSAEIWRSLRIDPCRSCTYVRNNFGCCEYSGITFGLEFPCCRST